MQVKIEVLKLLKKCPLVAKGIAANIYRCPASVQLVDEVELLGFATDGHAAVQWSLGVEALADPNPETAWCGVPPHLFRVAEDYAYHSEKVCWEAGNVYVTGRSGTVVQFGRQIYSETLADAVLTGPGPAHKVAFEGRVRDLLAVIKELSTTKIGDEPAKQLWRVLDTAFDSSLLVACLKVLDKASVIKIHVADKFDPAFITCEGEKYYQAVVMPIRL